jgi:hypothetical protein
MLGVLAGMLLREGGRGAPELAAQPVGVLRRPSIRSRNCATARACSRRLAARPRALAVERRYGGADDTLQAQVQWVINSCRCPERRMRRRI